jgi:hypothetical protein
MKVVQPNWPSEDDPDFTPDFDSDTSVFEEGNKEDKEFDELREDIRELAVEE